MFPLLVAALLAPAERPNILLINVDDLGINDLGCYGRSEHNTPHLDRLAREGVRFTASYCSQPICSPSRAGLLTGKHPPRLHLTTFLPGRPDAPSQRLLHPRIRQQLPLEEITLALRLRRAGYATACIGKWHLGGKGFGPGEHGFDTVFAGRANTTPSATEGGKGEYELTARAEQFLTDNRQRPFFLYLAHHNPHIPLAARKELIDKNAGAFHPLYAAVIETLDDSIGRLLRKLDDLKLRDRTVVLFTSDNGGLHVPELNDHAPTHNTPFRAGKGFLYEGGLRIPLIIRYPGVLRPGTVQQTPVVHTDLVPTLLQWLGLEVPADSDGVSLVGLLQGKNLAARSLYWHFPHYNNQGGRPGGAVRQGDWKLVHYYDSDRSELYHLGEDPGEASDRAASEANRVRTMHNDLVAWRRRIGAQENTPNPNFNPTLYRQLYEDVDVSKLRPAHTAAEMTPGLKSWRQTMDRVVGAKKAKK